jgi:carbonic anhydrase
MHLPPRLIDGYRSFVDGRLPVERSRYEKLAVTGQRPDVMVICCCDSRVSPEVIFDAHPGEMFVLRNVANLVPPYIPGGMTHGVSAALEFAVEILGVKHILVMGHSHCGGIRAFVEHRSRPDPSDFIDNWMAMIAPAADAMDVAENKLARGYLDHLERASVVATLSNLLTFPAVAARVGDGRLDLIGAFFDVATGDVAVYDPAAGQFAPPHEPTRDQSRPL